MKRFVRLMVVLLVACVVSSCSITRELEQNASPIAFTEVNNYFVKNNSVPQKLLRKVINTLTLRHQSLREEKKKIER